jgi:hypothetical protein
VHIHLRFEAQVLLTQAADPHISIVPDEPHAILTQHTFVFFFSSLLGFYSQSA